MQAHAKSGQWLHLIETAVQDAPDPVFIIDRQREAPGLCFLYANQAFADLSGYGAAHLVGRSLLLLSGPRTEAAALERIRAAIRANGTLNEEILQYRQDGTVFWAGLTLFPLRDAAGHETCFLGIVRDVSEQRRAQREKKAAEQMLAAVFAGIDAGVLVIDETGIIALANPRAAARLQVSIPDLVGQPLAGFIRQQEDGNDGKKLHWCNPDGASFDVPFTAATVDQPDGRHFRVLTIAGATPGAARPRPPIAEPRTLVAGRMQMVGLDEVRSAFGSAWPRIAKRAHEIAVERIGEYLQPGDTFAPGHDETYILQFNTLGEDQAARTAFLIGQHLRLSLIEEFSNPQLGTIAANAAEVKLQPGEPAGDSSLTDLLSARLILARQTLEQQALKAVRQTLREETVAFHRVVSGKGTPSALWRVACPDAVQQLLDRSRQMLPGTPETTVEIDSHLLGKAAERIYLRLHHPEPGFVIVPVDWRSLSGTRAATLYLDLCGELPEPIRGRMLFEIVNLPPAMEFSRLSSMLARLQTLGRGAAVQLNSAGRHMLPLASLNTELLTLDARTLNLETERSQLGQLQLQSSKKRLLLTNVATHADGRKFAAAGIDLMTGPAFAGLDGPVVPRKPQSRPAAPRKFTAQRAPHMVP